MNLTREQIESLKPDTALDCLIAEHVFGQTCVDDPYNPRGVTMHYRNHVRTNVPKFSTDIAAAWRVVEANGVSGYLVLEEAPTDDRWRATFWFSGDDSVSAYGDTAPLAICRAGLLSVLHQQDREAGKTGGV